MIPTISLAQDTFEQIYETARKRIPVLYPEWTNFNTNDSGIAILELLSWLKEIQEFHMDQISEEHLRSFLKLLGVSPKHTQPAHAVVHCEPIDSDMIVPEGAEFAAGEVPFRAMEAVKIYAGKQVSMRILDSSKTAVMTRDCQDERKKLQLTMFGEKGKAGSCFELCLDTPFRPGQTYGFYFTIKDDYEVRRNPMDENFIPLVEISAEYNNNRSKDWFSCPIIRDDTYAFLQSGILRIQLPPDVPEREDEAGCRLRFVVMQGEYDVIPVLEYLDLNPLELIQCSPLYLPGEAVLGDGTGFPNQKYETGVSGLVADSVRIAAEDPEHPGYFEKWFWVEDFSASGPEDRHFTVDERNGFICFGDNIRGLAPEGEIRLLAASQTNGLAGNVKKGQIYPVPGPDGKIVSFKAVNEEDILDGADAETIEQCLERLHVILQRNDCAVTKQDIETMVLDTPGLMLESAKAVRIDSANNCVYVAVKPWSDKPEQGLSNRYIENIMRHMESRRLIGTNLQIIEPEYVGVSLYLELELSSYLRDSESRIRNRLISYFKKHQSEFGKPIRYSALYGSIEGNPSVKRIISLTIDAGGHGIERNTEGDVILPPNGLSRLELVQCSVSYSG